MFLILALVALLVLVFLAMKLNAAITIGNWFAWLHGTFYIDGFTMFSIGCFWWGITFCYDKRFDKRLGITIDHDNDPVWHIR